MAPVESKRQSTGNLFEEFACGAGNVAVPTGGVRPSNGRKRKSMETGSGSSSMNKVRNKAISVVEGKGLVDLVDDCSDQNCNHRGCPVLLRLLIVGHNPSQVAWEKGHYYANPNNWMWRILIETGIADERFVFSADEDWLMPGKCGVGFTDVGSGVPGTRSGSFSSSYIRDSWRGPFFDRLRQISGRAGAYWKCRCSNMCGSPAIIAFSGKRQFIELFDSKEQSPDYEVIKSNRCPVEIQYGRQHVLPSGWPLPGASAEVWVLPSTSGAAAMTRDDRFGPWQRLADRLGEIPFPRSVCCNDT
eukprot:jgi/Picsp_1/5598/NSC_02957-R1_g u mismatch-specific dna glycosylase